MIDIRAGFEAKAIVAGFEDMTTTGETVEESGRHWSERTRAVVGLIAGYGVQFWPILHDIHQLRAIYGKRAGTFLSNAGVIQFFGVNDFETAELVGKTIGKTDAQYFTGSWGEGKRSTSEHISARDLINMRLSAARMILLRQGQRPAIVAKLGYHTDPEFEGIFDH